VPAPWEAVPDAAEGGATVIFKAIGIVVALYTLYAAASGRVYAKSGPGGRCRPAAVCRRPARDDTRAGGRTVSRQETPVYFWTVVAIYAGLSVALIGVF